MSGESDAAEVLMPGVAMRARDDGRSVDEQIANGVVLGKNSVLKGEKQPRKRQAEI